MLGIETLLKLFPLPKVPTPPHHNVGRFDGVNRAVESVVFAKTLSLDNAFALTVKYPQVTDKLGVHPAMTIVGTYHIMDNAHVPERIKVNGVDVDNDQVHEHTGLGWIGFSFEWTDPAGHAHRADVRSYIDLDILGGLL